MLARRDQFEQAPSEIAEASAQAITIGRLRCLRGIDTLTAVGLAAEVGDFRRFTHPRLLASYLGLVPSEQSSDEQPPARSATRAGSKHARRLLVEAAWQYRYPPRVSSQLARRQRGHDPRVIDAACTIAGSGSTSNAASRRTVVAVAEARELAASCWEVATLNS